MTPLTPEEETAALRHLMKSTGISHVLDEETADIPIEDAAAFIARMKAQDAAQRAQDAPARSTRRKWTSTVLIAAAATVASTIVLVVQPWTHQSAIATTPPILNFEFAQANRIAYAPGKDPHSTLMKLADAAARQPTPARKGNVQYVVTEEMVIHRDMKDQSRAVLVPTIDQTWTNPDGSTRDSTRLGKPLTADGRGVPKSGSWDSLPKAFPDDIMPKGSRDPNFFQNMPNTVSGVRKALLDNVGCLDRKPGQERSLCLFDQVRDFPRQYIIDPQKLSKIWKVLAGEVGYTTLGRVVDRAGRQGVGISFIWQGAPQYREIIIADPKTGAFLGTEKILIKRTADLDLKPPAITGFMSIIQSEYR